MSSEPPTAGAFSKLIVYVDESGDHGPVSAEFPVFVLAFCIFDKHEYANTVTSYMHRLKFKHFGHDAVVMHEELLAKVIALAATRADSGGDREGEARGAARGTTESVSPRAQVWP